MAETLDTIWPNWTSMPQNERIARLAALAVAPTGLNAVTKEYVDRNFHRYLRVTDRILVEAHKG